MIALSENPLHSSSRVLRTLIGFVLIVICLGSVVALVVYSDAHNATESNNPVSRTQDALLDLSAVAQQLDRVELDARLYRLSADEEHLQAAQGAAVAMNTLLLRLKQDLADNRSAETRVADLIGAAGNLTSTLSRLTPSSVSIRDQVVNCRQVLSVLQDEQRNLLTHEKSDAQRNDLFGLARRTSVIGIGSVLILILFALLTRDLVRRGRFEAQISETNERLRLTVQHLEEQAWASRLLISARDEVALCLEVKLAEETTLRYLGQLLPGTAGILCILNNSRQVLESAGTWGGMDAVAFDGWAADSCCAVRSGRIRWRRPERSEVHCTHFAGKAPERYVCLPLTAHGETLGIVSVELPTAEAAVLTETRENTLISLGETAAMAISGLNLRQKLESQSIRDGMTGLFNRSFMEIALEREITRAARQGKQIAVMMLDIDHFKQFNDTFGHEAGDVVLRDVAETMRLGVRSEDIVCRYGGEEFVVILPEITTRAAMERAELLRRMVGDLALHYRGQPLRQVTISIGVAMFPEHSELPEELLRTADHALYAAKHKGRNRVVPAAAAIRA